MTSCLLLHAKKVQQWLRARSLDEPSTSVHKLVENLCFHVHVAVLYAHFAVSIEVLDSRLKRVSWQLVRCLQHVLLVERAKRRIEETMHVGETAYQGEQQHSKTASNHCRAARCGC